jgi:hypothetical protein
MTGLTGTARPCQRRRTMTELDKLTIGEAKQLAALFCPGTPGTTQNKRLPMKVGDKLFIRGVTMAYTGRVKAWTDAEVELEDAAWIADTGRFAQAMEKGDFSEVEPYPPGETVVVNRDAVSDWRVISFDLPRSQK